MPLAERSRELVARVCDRVGPMTTAAPQEIRYVLAAWEGCERRAFWIFGMIRSSMNKHCFSASFRHDWEFASVGENIDNRRQSRIRRQAERMVQGRHDLGVE